MDYSLVKIFRTILDKGGYIRDIHKYFLFFIISFLSILVLTNIPTEQLDIWSRNGTMRRYHFIT